MRLSLTLPLILAGSLAGCTADRAMLENTASNVLSQVGQLAGSGALSEADIGAGLKQALTVGTDTVVSQLGAAGGFSADPTIRIPLPDSLQKARKAASKVGLGGQFDELEQRLNAAAEAATPRAGELFVDAISNMTVTDAKGILGGPDDAATQYLRKQMGPSLERSMAPVVEQSLADVGALQSYDDLIAKAGPFAALLPDLGADLQAHVTGAASDGIFHYVAEEEAAIRANPAKRTTELLQRVFQ